MSKRFLLLVVFFLASCAPKAANAVSQATSAVETSLDTQGTAPTAVPDIEVGVVIVNILNVRQGPGTSYPTIGSLNKGEKFYVLGETTNSTNNKWLLISLSNNSFGWITGDKIYVTVQQEAVDADTYSTWQKNVAAAKSLIPVTSP